MSSNRKRGSSAKSLEATVLTKLKVTSSVATSPYEKNLLPGFWGRLSTAATQDKNKF